MNSKSTTLLKYEWVLNPWKIRKHHIRSSINSTRIQCFYANTIMNFKTLKLINTMQYHITSKHLLTYNQSKNIIKKLKKKKSPKNNRKSKKKTHWRVWAIRRIQTMRRFSDLNRSNNENILQNASFSTFPSSNLNVIISI